MSISTKSEKNSQNPLIEELCELGKKYLPTPYGRYFYLFSLVKLIEISIINGFTYSGTPATEAEIAGFAGIIRSLLSRFPEQELTMYDRQRVEKLLSQLDSKSNGEKAEPELSEFADWLRHYQPMVN